MKTNLIVASLMLAAASVGLAPSAAADETVCVDNACVYTASGSGGSGNCDASDSWFEEYRRVGVTVMDGSTSHNAYVQNYCYVYGWGDYQETGSGLAVAYYSMDYETWEYRALGVQWWAYEWSNGASGDSFCAVTVYSFGMDPLPTMYDNYDCPTGDGPGLILPALP